MEAASEDLRAIERLLAVAPAWNGIPTAAEAVGLNGHMLLHCGPHPAAARCHVPDL